MFYTLYAASDARCLESCVLSLWSVFSTPVENVRQIGPFLCKTNPIFPHFSPENDDFTKKQTQFKANTKPFSRKAKNESKYL